MARGRTQQLLVGRFQDGDVRRAPDRLAVEEPLELRLDGHLVTTTMRTPGHDFELAVGFCHGEGLLAGAPVVGVRYCSTDPCGTRTSAAAGEFNVVTVDTGGRAPRPEPRLTTTTSACGWCGTAAIDDLAARLGPRPAVAPFPLDVLASAPERLRPGQELFEATGGVHAAGALDREGRLVLVREDVGRHNAVDKVVGRLLLDGQVPAGRLALVVSGRASFEIVQKAWAGGFAAVVAVSAPSSLAVATARAAGLQLVGFAREGRMNVYSPAP